MIKFTNESTDATYDYWGLADDGNYIYRLTIWDFSVKITIPKNQEKFRVVVIYFAIAHVVDLSITFVGFYISHFSFGRKKWQFARLYTDHIHWVKRAYGLSYYDNGRLWSSENNYQVGRL